MTTETDNKARVRQFLSDLSAGNVNAVVAAYAKNGSVETMGATLISGTTDFTDLQQAISSIIQVFPQGLRFTIHGMVAEGEKVAVEASSEGEHSSGQTYSNDYHFLFEFDKGLL
ncbi:MAG: nuclear transport factor 2 family protein, partial [Haliea sp.]|nr:nuclear transport factor 2 family protein [Haliea sp.]